MTHRQIRSALLAGAAVLLFATHAVHGDLVSHYDAGAITGVGDGASVTLWQDISGHGNDASSGGQTYVASGIGGLPSIQFALQTQGFVSTHSMGSQFGIQGDASWSMVVVFQWAQFFGGHSQVATLGTGQSVNTGALIELQGGNLDLATGFANDVRLQPDDSFSQFLDTDLIVVYSHQGGTGGSIFDTTELWINGYTPGEGILTGLFLGALGNTGTASLALADQPLVLGGAFISATSSFGGLLSEVMVFNQELGNAQRDATIAQLGRKYGISVKPAAVPEPATLAPGLLALLGIVAVRHRRRAYAQ